MIGQFLKNKMKISSNISISKTFTLKIKKIK